MTRTEEDRSTARLARLKAAMDRAEAAYEAEILRLASLSPPVDQGDIASAAGRTRVQIAARERAAGLPPRRRGRVGGREGDPALGNAA